MNNSDSEEELAAPPAEPWAPPGMLPVPIGDAAAAGDFERVKVWLAGGTASAPRSIHDVDNTGWTLLMWTCASGDEETPCTPEHVEFARYLISQGIRLDARSTITGNTALHYACEVTGECAAAMVSLLIAAGAPVNVQSQDGETPIFTIHAAAEGTIDVVTTLLRAGASLDYTDREGSTHSFEEHLNIIYQVAYRGNIIAIRNLVASVRTAGSWKAHCRLAHKQVLRLRSLVARGRAKLPRTRRRSSRGRDVAADVRQERALNFLVRQGDNGIVWNILSFWRATN